VITRDIKEGCAILQRQAESLKIQYGSALGDLAQEDKVVTIPGISGRDPKEISFKSLAYIIQSRMEEIIDAVTYEIENSGYMDKLSAGIVLTGGGSMLRHLNQLVKFKTGLDVRVGFPGEMMAADTPEQINQPMFSTSVGLLLKGLEYYEEKKECMVIEEHKETEAEAAQVIEEGRKIRKGLKKGRIFESLKNTLSDIFDETDVKM
jgi:cell division protein FtsA